MAVLAFLLDAVWSGEELSCFPPFLPALLIETVPWSLQAAEISFFLWHRPGTVIHHQCPVLRDRVNYRDADVSNARHSLDCKLGR